MSHYRIIDNLMPSQVADNIESVMLSPKFNWHLESVELPTTENKCQVDYQFVHPFFFKIEIKSEFIDLIRPIIHAIKPGAIGRIKANLHPKTDRILNKQFHIDNDLNCLTAIYYVNTNNGLTIFENGVEVNSVKNRLLVFNSSMIHKGTTCTDNSFRCVININYFNGPHGIQL